MIKIHAIEYHRNGVAGNGFHAILFTCPEHGNFLATVFPEKGQCAVINTDLLITNGVKLGINSWRGDWFETELRKAIASQDEQESSK